MIILLWDRHCTCYIFKNRHFHINPGALLSSGCADYISKSTKGVCKHPFFLHGEQLREKALRSSWLLRDWPDAQEGRNLKIEANVAGLYLRCLRPMSNLFSHDDSRQLTEWFKFSWTHSLPAEVVEHSTQAFHIPFPSLPPALLLPVYNWDWSYGFTHANQVLHHWAGSSAFYLLCTLRCGLTK